jgi:anaerobic selenocysteine-containing dehydrogenase
MSSQVVRTACTLDCPDACTLDVTVTDGVITDIDAAVGDDVNPITSGFICRKVQMSTKRIYSPERIATPLIRVGKKGEGEFRSATWDEALDLVASRITTGITVLRRLNTQFVRSHMVVHGIKFFRASHQPTRCRFRNQNFLLFGERIPRHPTPTFRH